LNIFTAMNIGL